MSLCTADLNRLSHLVEGLLDADILLDEDAGALLEAIETIRRALNAGDMEAARRHILQLGLVTEALVQTDALTMAEGQAVIQVADRLLNSETDGGEEAR